MPEAGQARANGSVAVSPCGIPAGQQGCSTEQPATGWDIG